MKVYSPPLRNMSLGRQKATMLSWISCGVGISTRWTAPSPQAPMGSTHTLGRFS